MININDATRALAPKPEEFRITNKWQQIETPAGASLWICGHPRGVLMTAGAHPDSCECAYFSSKSLRELSAFCAALADHLDRGQG